MCYVGNTAENFQGGAISYIGGSGTITGPLTIQSCTFEYNSAAFGGVIAATKGAVAYIKDSTMRHNLALSLTGGAIHLANQGGYVEVKNCDVSYNYARQHGIDWLFYLLLVSTFSDSNCFFFLLAVSPFAGGGMFIEDDAQVLLDTVTFDHNVADTLRGGAICLRSVRSGIFKHVNFLHNTATTNGGGLAAFMKSVSLSFSVRCCSYFALVVISCL